MAHLPRLDGYGHTRSRISTQSPRAWRISFRFDSCGLRPGTSLIPAHFARVTHAAYNGHLDESQPSTVLRATIPQERMKTAQPIDNRERVLLVGVGLKKAPRGRAGDSSSSGRDSLEELRELAESAGAKIEASLLQVRDTLDPATLVGRGKLDEIRIEAEMRRVPLVIVDHDLTPGQLRNFEKGVGRRVIRS